MQIAENVIRSWHGRLPWALPASIDVYAYPDLDSFRNATGEPGWVAARTSATKIELQPAAVLQSHGALRSTVEHEMLHCFVESAARPGLPLWFREGLVEYLAGGPIAIASGALNEQDMRQRQDGEAARKAYRAAEVLLDGLVKRYGETAVLGWVSRGLPEEVKNSTASNPAVNNK
jgi:stage II sporulation protein D